ncbi:MAG TPA: hypothetical protein VF062_27505 [Candidatus Limnocylindrales bacterium]
MTDSPSYSISVRLRRVTAEEGFVSVPVTEAVMRAEPEPDGSFRLDTKKLFAEAVRLGADAAWQVESREIEVHPIQTAPGWMPEAGR